jgi:hypothetical protein
MDTKEVHFFILVLDNIYGTSILFMNELSNHKNTTQNTESDLRVLEMNQIKDDIIEKLHNNIKDNEKLVPIEVQSTLLCSNNIVSDCTSIGVNTFDKNLLKQYLKNLALKILEEEYEKYRNSGFDIHQSFNASTGN